MWFAEDFWWGTEEECFHKYSNPFAYPWTPYGDYYDRIHNPDPYVAKTIVERLSNRRNDLFDYFEPSRFPFER
jgi:hypothetical protein